MTWTLELPDRDAIVVRTTVAGDPQSKQRPRLGKGGRVYTPKATESAEEHIGWAVKRAMRGQCSEDTAFGIRVVFHCASWQRRDVDNMLKLVADACTGIVWKDDSQVTEMAARVIRGCDSGATELTVYRLDDPLFPTSDCDHCGEPYRVYESTRGSRRFCSRECMADFRRKPRHHVQCDACGKGLVRTGNQVKRAPTGLFYCDRTCAAVPRSVELECNRCGATFRRPRSIARRNANAYCTEECRADYWREHRRARSRGVCKDCGGPTSKKSYERCQACAIDAKRRSA